jgi:hypothetical protein
LKARGRREIARCRREVARILFVVKAKFSVSLVVVICRRAEGEHISTAAYVPAVDPKRHVDKSLVRKSSAPRVLRDQLKGKGL